MKIGVVTYSTRSDNYGQVLQYLATQEFLKEFGHEVFLLRRFQKNDSLIKKLLRPAYRFVKKITSYNSKKDKFQEQIKIFSTWRTQSARSEKEHPRYFENFRKSFFKIEEDDGSFFKEKKFDAYCSGSDQIWADDVFFYYLEFAPINSIRFSIAPSIGYREITESFVERVRSPLSRFSFITVREKSAEKLCEKAGRPDAHVVLDPTFLLSHDRYRMFATKERKTRPYIFLYLLGADISVSVEDIFDFAKKNGYDVKYVASQGRDDKFSKIYATVEEWLGLLADAEYVVTNSFHGMALSVIHHKRFIVFPVIGVLSTMNERIENIADTFCLTDRIYHGNMDVLFEPIDWSKTDSIIAQNRDLMSSLILLLNK